MSTSDPRIALLLRLIDESFDHKGWHGTTLLGAVRGVSAGDAAWKPAPDRHSIWELVLHAAYWKYAVRQRIAGGRRGAFERPGSNWFPVPAAADDRSWKADVALLREEHRRLREVVASLAPEELGRRAGEGDVARLIYGIAQHDVYHTGQIQLLKRLRAESAV